MRQKLIDFRGNVPQWKIAKKYGVTQQAWSRYEKGIASPRWSLMLQLEKDSGIPMEELFFDRFQQHNSVNDAN